MTRKKFFILIGALLILLLLSLFFFLLYVQKKNGGNESLTQTFRSFLPFGAQNGSNGFQNNGDQNSDSGTQNPNQNSDSGENSLFDKVPKLRQITTTPTAGSVIIERDREAIQDRVKKTIKEFFVRYMDRGTGHISETKTTALPVTEISNATMPEIYETLFSADGNSFISRSLAEDNNTIKTYSGSLKTSAAAPTTASSTLAATSTVVSFKDITGNYLPSDIKGLALSPSQNKLLSSFYDIPNDGGILSLSDRAGGKPKTIFSSALRDWLLYFPTETKAVIATKPSGTAVGAAFTLDVGTGAISKLAGGITGFTVLPSRDLSYILMGTGGNTLFLSILRTADKSQTGQTLNTIPEKCVWAKTDSSVFYCAVPQSIPNAIFPDAWYQGLVSFNDSIWKINIKTGDSSLIAVPETLAHISIDATNLDISGADNYLTFINKKDLTLWGLDLGPVAPASVTATSSITTTQ